MRRVFPAVVLVGCLASIVMASSGCEGGGSGQGDRGASSTSGANGTTGGDSCELRTTLSGGIDLTLVDVSQACVYSSRSIGFASLDGRAVVLLLLEKIERGQTGSVGAEIQVSSKSEYWAGAKCSLNVESNVKVQAASDAGVSFDQYLLKGTGSCSTPAVFRGDGGAREPITITPFTFVFRTLFY
jgi:hypothetical protein